MFEETRDITSCNVDVACGAGGFGGGVDSYKNLNMVYGPFTGIFIVLTMALCAVYRKNFRVV